MDVALENSANSHCVTIAHCNKDIQGHLRSFGAGLADSSIKNEAELLLSRAGRMKSFMYLFILLWVNNFSGGSRDRFPGGSRRVRPHPTLIFKPN